MTHKLPSFFTEDQMIALASAPDRDTLHGARDRAMLGVLLGSALRASELCSLTVTDVLPDRVFVRCGKFGHQRWVPLACRSWLAIQRYLSLQPAAGGDPLFRTADGRPITRRYLHKVITGYQRAVGLPACGVHVCRHSAATRMINHGLGLQTVRVILGHVRIESTVIYLSTGVDQVVREYQATCDSVATVGPR